MGWFDRLSGASQKEGHHMAGFGHGPYTLCGLRVNQSNSTYRLSGTAGRMCPTCVQRKSAGCVAPLG